MFERDYLMREVKKLVELLAKIAKLRQTSELETALVEVRSAYDRLGVSRSMLDFIDPASLIRMTGSADVVLAVGRLMEEEAALLEARGDPAAPAKQARALTLVEAATAAGGSLDQRQGS